MRKKKPGDAPQHEKVGVRRCGPERLELKITSSLWPVNVRVRDKVEYRSGREGEDDTSNRDERSSTLTLTSAEKGKRETERRSP